MFSKSYYTTKQQKLQQKLAKVKDQFIVDSLNMAQRLANEIQEIQIENNEINQIIKENEPTKKEEKKKGK